MDSRLRIILNQVIIDAAKEGCHNPDVAQGIRIGFKAGLEATYPLEEEYNFEDIYKEYPRKEGKQTGFKKCRIIVKSQKIFLDLKKAVDNYAKAVEHQDKQYIYKFSNFMEHWEDWIEVPEDHNTTVDIRKILKE